jgi:hypothetical protein
MRIDLYNNRKDPIGGDCDEIEPLLDLSRHPFGPFGMLASATKPTPAGGASIGNRFAGAHPTTR